MSILDLLKDDNSWSEFLKEKEESTNLSKSVIERYKEFISKQKYESIVNQIEDETYEFSIPRKVLIGKMGTNKKRTVYIYKKDEVYVLKMITYLLYKYDYLFAPNLYSFRKDRCVKNAIAYIKKRHFVGNMFAYKVDIQNYFNSIPVQQLLEMLKNDLNDNKLWNMINKILANDKVVYENKVIEEEKGIMAGVPISAFLANYYLKDLDFYFYNNNIPYLRYADDIITFSKDKETLIKNSELIKKFLVEKGLNVNSKKEFFYEKEDKVDFLGFSFQRGIIDVGTNSFRKIKGKIRRSARGLRQWMIKNEVKPEIVLKLMNKKYNNKFFGKEESELTWKYWYFPSINTDKTLKEIDRYMQDMQRYLVTGMHNKKNYKKVPYSFLKKCKYKSLVNEYHKFCEERKDS